MSSIGFHNRDKILSSFNSILEISGNYGFSRHVIFVKVILNFDGNLVKDSDFVNNIDTTSNKIIEILQQIEYKNDILNEVIDIFLHAYYYSN